MCGIYGITAEDPKFIDRCIDRCSYRGPDGDGIWQNDYVTLGHNLLSIMAAPNVSRQPWETPKGNILVYNGEIFNYNELKKRYLQFRLETTCDTELLAWGLDYFGLEFLNDIDSQHAFAYYNVENKILTLSRDHVGIKPLYYCETEQGLIFGSELKIFKDKVSFDINWTALSCYAYTGVNALSQTYYKKIKRLLPGEIIEYDCKNKVLKKTKNFFKPKTPNIIKFDAEQYRSVVRDVVLNSTLGIRRIGVPLSGGLDSTIITHELKQIKGSVNVFSCNIAPTYKEPDEDYRLAKILSTGIDLNFTTVDISPKTIIEDWDNSIRINEDPYMSEDLPMAYRLNKVMSDNNIVVVLFGGLGDETMAGYNFYRNVKPAMDTITNKRDMFRLWLTRVPQIFKHKDLLSKEDLIDLLDEEYNTIFFDNTDILNSFMLFECLALAPGRFFERNDKFAMNFSMEGRYPLASKKFMDYAFSMPSKIKNVGETKSLVRQAYNDILPEEIIASSKRGWDIPKDEWVSQDADYKIFNSRFKQHPNIESWFNINK